MIWNKSTKIGSFHPICSLYHIIKPCQAPLTYFSLFGQKKDPINNLLPGLMFEGVSEWEFLVIRRSIQRDKKLPVLRHWPIHRHIDQGQFS